MQVKPLPQRHLDLVFEDGLQAKISLDQIIDHYSGVFAPLLEDSFFQQVQVAHELGTIFWPNGADLCPDVLYSILPESPLTGADGYIAPQHLKAVQETGSQMVTALDKHDSVGILDSYFPGGTFFTEYERSDQPQEKLRRENE